MSEFVSLQPQERSERGQGAQRRRPVLGDLKHGLLLIYLTPNFLLLGRHPGRAKNQRGY